MDLVDRYLNEIGRRLPKTKRGDIRAELRSALDDALEGRAGTQPIEEETISVLKEFGSPEAVAASYRGDRYLIGPRLYPQFKITLRVVLTVLAGLVVLGSAVAAFGGSLGLSDLAARMGGLLSGLIDAGLTAIGVIVLVFAVVERLDVADEIPEKEWDPRKLPAVRDADLVGRFDAYAGIVFPAVIVLLLNLFRDRIGLFVNTGGELLLNDVFLDNLHWLNASLLLPAALSACLFWTGRWHWTARLAKIAMDLFGLFVFHRVCQGVIGAQAQLLAAGIPERVVEIFARVAQFSPYGLAVLVVIGGTMHLYRAYRSLS